MSTSDLKETVQFIDRALDAYHHSDESAASVKEQYALSKKLHGALVGSGVSEEEFRRIFSDGLNDIGAWLVDLPFRLAHYQMIDEAVEVCRHFSTYLDAENLLGDLSVILAEAGRKQEALDQVEENLNRFPEDVWVIIKAGEALEELREPVRALELYRRAYVMTRPGEYDREGVLERLIILLRESGKDDEADDLEEIEEEARNRFISDWEKLKPVAPIRSEKIGRNDTCPCGSGKKYKKCCIP